VDVLVAECSLPESLAWERHMTPAGIAALARAVAPGRLVLTHVYPQLDRNALPALVRGAGWDGEVMVADDGLTLEL
jgi:ribonuclease BN (tRNA processing enzyme)